MGPMKDCGHRNFEEQDHFSGNRIPDNGPFLVSKLFQLVENLGAVAAFVYFGTVFPKPETPIGPVHLKQVYQQLSVYRYNAVDDGRFGQEIVGIKKYP